MKSRIWGWTGRAAHLVNLHSSKIVPFVNIPRTQFSPAFLLFSPFWVQVTLNILNLKPLFSTSYIQASNVIVVSWTLRSASVVTPWWIPVVVHLSYLRLQFLFRFAEPQSASIKLAVGSCWWENNRSFCVQYTEHTIRLCGQSTEFLNGIGFWTGLYSQIQS